jgi:hypothetical protein
MQDHSDDFTESSYKELLILAKSKYSFEFFDTNLPDNSIALWRHDVDFSVHRAKRIGEIENEVGVNSTFFIHLHNDFYNPLELEITRLLDSILNAGNCIGLHFDPNYYGSKIKNESSMFEFLDFEFQILNNLLGIKSKVFSFHNPDIGGWLDIQADQIGGFVNTYGNYFKNRFEYCSDSNGYWRFKRLEDFLLEGHENIQVLTHPGWWTDGKLLPFEKIKRAVIGRSENVIQRYNSFLESNNRKNIGR